MYSYRSKYQSKNKYRNKKAEIDGITFDSIKEAKRYEQLKLLEQAGEITNLQRQVKYILIPSQRDISTYTKTGREKPGKVIERECAYYADFVYTDKDGTLVVEDTKGMRTSDYKIKRKLMLYVHGIRITEI